MKDVRHVLLVLSTIWILTKALGDDQLLDAYNEVSHTIPNAFDNTSTFDGNFFALLAIFCPDSVFCPADEDLKTDWTSTALNESTVFYKWIFANASDSVTAARRNLVNLSPYIKGCCKACSCANSCLERRNCCPVLNSKLETNKVEQRTPTILQECVHSSIKQYVQDSTEVPNAFYGQSYYMVVACFLSNTASETTKQKCRYPDVLYRDQITPVYSPATDRTYRNKYCAECNDDVSVAPWTLRIVLPSHYGSAFLDNISNSSSTYQSIIKVVNRQIDIVFVPPNQLKINVEDPLCLHQPKGENKHKQCNMDSHNIDKDIESFLLDSCSNYNYAYRTVVKPYQNVICYFCILNGAIGHADIDCTEWRRFYNFDDRFTALLGIGSEKYISTKDSFTECRCNEIFDKRKNICRPLICPIGEIFHGCVCKPFFEMMSGLPLRLYASLVPLVHTSHVQRTAQKDSFVNKVKATVSQKIKSFNEAFDISVTAIFQENGQMDERHTKFHILSIIHVKNGNDGHKLTQEIFNWLHEGVKVQVSKISMMLSLGEIYDVDYSGYRYKFVPSYTQTNTSDIVNVYSNPKRPSYLMFRFAALMDKFLFCKSIQLSQEEDETMPNNALEHGYSATWLRYIYRSIDKTCCLDDYMNIFTSLAVCLSVNHCLIVIILLSLVSI